MPGKYPLRESWTLWYDSAGFHKTYAETRHPIEWKQNIKEVYTFDSLENFYRLYNNIEEPMGIWYKSSYHIFLKGVAPHCLDLNNQDGITIHYLIEPSADLDEAWLQTILTIISGKYDNINGISIQKCKNYYELIIWMRTRDDSYMSDFKKIYDDFKLNIKYIYTLTLEEKFTE